MIVVVNFRQWASMMKIKHDDNLTDRIFLTRNFSDLQYMCTYYGLDNDGKVNSKNEGKAISCLLGN